MPARMVRENLLSSDRFLSLPDNTARICYVCLLLNADDRGNVEASSGQLVRMWRDFGIDGTTKADSVAQFLADQDLIRLYESDSKRYIHIPRFGQRMRHLKRACPESPWCKDEQKQQHDQENDRRKTVERQTVVSLASAEVKRREVKRSTPLRGFEEFWAAYPKRLSRGRAEKAWSQLKPNEQLIVEILQAIERAKTSEQWLKDGGQFIPHPASWLNAKGWLDEGAAVQRGVAL